MSKAGYVEIIYIDSNENARKTGLRAAGETWEETIECFESAKTLQCGIDVAEFLCDLHNDDGDIVQTVGLSRQAVEQITGEKTKSDAEYIDYDSEFWSDILAERHNEMSACS